MNLILAVPPHTTPSPSYSLHPPAPTPYSLFQSVPENFQETDVFHLSQNVDFGKKLGVSGPVTSRPQPQPNNVAFNEVDTGLETQSFLERLYCHNVCFRECSSPGRFPGSLLSECDHCPAPSSSPEAAQGPGPAQAGGRVPGQPPARHIHRATARPRPGAKQEHG